MSESTVSVRDILPDLLSVLRTGIIVLNQEGHVLLGNAAAAELLNLPLEKMGASSFFGVPLARELKELEGSFWSAMADPDYTLDAERECSLMTATGPRDVRIRLRKLVIRDVWYALLVVDDNERIKRTERALAAALGEAQDQALRDPLTGLFNRRHIESVLPAELNRAQRTGSSLAMMIIDLDHFKSINDRFGHPMGDRVLVEVSRLLNRVLRVGDTSARIGGEEFCVLLPNSQDAAALRAADRLQRVIRALRFEEEPSLRVTASIGIAIAVLSNPITDLAGEAQRLFAQSDSALYQAKQNGRDQTVISK